jgi:hypothetical protein
VLAVDSDLDPAPQADDSPPRPPTHGGWIGQVGWVLAVWGSLLGSFTGGYVLASLLPAVQGERGRWCQPIGQDGEGLSARPTNAAPHPNPIVTVIVGISKSLPVAHDRVITTKRTSPREKVQGDHPGSNLSSASGSAIKRITAGVKAAADRRCQVSIWGLAFTLPVKSVSNEKRILLSDRRRRPSANRPSFSVRGRSQVSVEQTDVVDILGIDRETGHVVLTISDHLDWSDTVGHQMILQKKLNRYLAFVESGEILEQYPNAKNRPVAFRVVFKFRLTTQDRSSSRGHEQ